MVQRVADTRFLPALKNFTTAMKNYGTNRRDQERHDLDMERKRADLEYLNQSRPIELQAAKSRLEAQQDRTDYYKKLYPFGLESTQWELHTKQQKEKRQQAQHRQEEVNKKLVNIGVLTQKAQEFKAKGLQQQADELDKEIGRLLEELERKQGVPITEMLKGEFTDAATALEGYETGSGVTKQELYKATLPVTKSTMRLTQRDMSRYRPAAPTLLPNGGVVSNFLDLETGKIVPATHGMSADRNDRPVVRPIEDVRTTLMGLKHAEETLKGVIPQNIQQEFIKNRQKDATRLDVLKGIIGLESSFDPQAKNPRSSATGYGQFLEGTWLGLIKEQPEILKSVGLDAQAVKEKLATAQGREEILSYRTDGLASLTALDAFTRHNARTLEKRGIEANALNLYLAHFFGAGTRLLKAPDHALLDNYLSEKELDQNPHLRGKRLYQLKADIMRRDKTGVFSGQTKRPTALSDANDPNYLNLVVRMLKLKARYGHFDDVKSGKKNTKTVNVGNKYQVLVDADTGKVIYDPRASSPLSGNPYDEMTKDYQIFEEIQKTGARPKTLQEADKAVNQIKIELMENPDIEMDEAIEKANTKSNQQTIREMLKDYEIELSLLTKEERAEVENLMIEANPQTDAEFKAHLDNYIERIMLDRKYRNKIEDRRRKKLRSLSEYYKKTGVKIPDKIKDQMDKLGIKY